MSGQCERGMKNVSFHVQSTMSTSSPCARLSISFDHCPPLLLNPQPVVMMVVTRVQEDEEEEEDDGDYNK